MSTTLSLMVEEQPIRGRLPAPARPAGVAIGFSDSESDAPTESEEEGDAARGQNDAADDEFVFDAPAYYDLANPALERRYVNNADGYFSSPAPSAATTVVSPVSEAPVEVKSRGGDADKEEVMEEAVARSLMSSYTSVETAAAASTAEVVAGSAFSQSVPTFAAFSQAVPSLGNQAPAGIYVAPARFKLPGTDAGNNVVVNAEMGEAETKTAVLSPVPFHPEDNQIRHEQDVDEHMSDAGSDGTVEMNTTGAMVDVEAPPEFTAQAVASHAEYEEEDAESVASILSRSLLSEGAPETLEEVLEHYASSSQSSATSYRMRDVDVSRGSIHSSQGSISPRRAGHHFQQPRSQPNMYYGEASYQQPPRPAGSYSARSNVPSSLLQPTESYIRRVRAEQRMREEAYMEDVPVQEKPHRVTKPHSPKLRTSRKAETKPRDPNDISRMSSTSRELLKIQEERLRLQMERMKIREFHERTKVHRPPANIFQRSTKQLTIPQSPHLSVDGRTRRTHRDASIDSNPDTTEGDAAKPAMITPEALLSRDYQYPATKAHSSLHHGAPHPTVPHTPQLQTAARSSRRGIVPDPHETEHPRRPTTSTTTRGLTQAATPSLETRRRALAAGSYRRPIDVTDKDEEELSKKFRARPLNKKILEPKHQSPSKAPEHAVSKASTTASRLNARAAGALGDMERRRQEREQQRATSSARPASAAPRRPVIPETPPLKSIQLHRQYQEQFRRRIEEEQKDLERKRDFKANPMRVTSTPPRFEGSSKPLTEMKPFAMPGERYHELARDRFEAKKREEEERLKEAAKFRANPMPVFTADSGSDSDRASKLSTKPLTTFSAPMLASDRRAAERAAFDAAERERREMEEAHHRRMEAEAKRLEEEEIRRMRKEAMVFHARPAPEPKSFGTRSNNQIDDGNNQ